MASAPTRILVVTDKTAATPELLDAIRERAERGPIHARVLVPNPAPAEWHPRHPERHTKADEARLVLEQTFGAAQGMAEMLGGDRAELDPGRDPGRECHLVGVDDGVVEPADP